MATTKKASQSDIIKLGAQVANLKASLPKKKWAEIVKAAHAKGYTVQSALSNTPDALKQRTQSSLQAEAKKTAATAYAPAYADLDKQSADVTAIEATRARDDKAYREWLAQKQGSLLSDAKAADTLIATQLGQIHKDSIQAWQDRQTQAVGTAGSAPGTVSDPAKSTALAQLAAAAQKSNESSETARVASVQQGGNAVAQMSVAGAAMLANQAAAAMKRTADSETNLQKIRDTRANTALKQAADESGILKDLRTAEASKAQTNQETAIAADKLNVDLQGLDFKKSQFATQVKQADRKFSLDSWIAKNKAITDQAKLDLGYANITAQQGKAEADRRLRQTLEQYRQGKLDKRQKDRLDAAAKTQADPNKKTPAQQKNEQTLFRQVSNVRRSLVQLHEKYGDSGVTKGGKKFRDVLIGRGADDALITIAEDLRRNNGKLSAHGVAVAKKAGIANPSAYWPIG